MRLCVLAKVTLVHSIGGMQVHCQRLAEGLASHGHEVVLLTTSHPDGITHEGTGGVDIRYLPETPAGLYSNAWWSASVRAVEELHATRRFDAILSEGLAGSAVARGGPPIPQFVFLQGFVLEHVVSEFHQAEGMEGFVRYLAIKIPEMLYFTLCHEVSVVRRARGIFIVSHRLSQFAHNWFRVPRSRVHVACNWVDCRHFRPDSERRRRLRTRLGIPPQVCLVLMASVLTRQKGVQVGLRALAQSAQALPDWLALVIGDGPYRKNLEREADALGLGSRVRFVGEIHNDATPDYYNAADLFLFPSLRLEGVPYVLLEAMASSLPVVAPASGNLPEVLGDGGCGRLVESGREAGFARALEELAGNSAMREQLGRAARQRALACYSEEAVLPSVIEVIERGMDTRQGIF